MEEERPGERGLHGHLEAVIAAAHGTILYAKNDGRIVCGFPSSLGLESWLRVRELTAELGYYPVITGPSGDGSAAAETALRQAGELDGASWLRRTDVQPSPRERLTESELRAHPNDGGFTDSVGRLPPINRNESYWCPPRPHGRPRSLVPCDAVMQSISGRPVLHGPDQQERELRKW